MNNVDSELVREYANTELRKRNNQVTPLERSEITQDSEMSTLYVDDANRMALLIGMSSTTDSLQRLTNELEGLVLDIKERLDSVVEAMDANANDAWIAQEKELP